MIPERAFKRGVVEAIASANGVLLSRTPKTFANIPLWNIATRKCRHGEQICHICGARVRGIPGSPEKPDLRVLRVDARLLTKHEGLKLVVFFIPRGKHIPAKPVIEGEIGLSFQLSCANAPTYLLRL